ncbi:MAG: methyltransferase [Nanoarchaeota archaeon]|nr:methyltransferase [Nanoarchaeota archaeon]
MSEVYPPSEDSYLIAKHIPRDLKGKKVLDIGTGSGLLAITAAINGGEVLAIDVNEFALKATQRSADQFGVKVETRISDLFVNVKGKFDLILFNPPYVPTDENDKYLSTEMQLATTSGSDGTDLINHFLKEFKSHLNTSGKVLMIISSTNKIKDNLENKGWKEVDNAAFFFERIYLMECFK